MNNKSFVALAIIAGLIAGAVGGFAAYKLAPQVGGDFAGGVIPSQLFTASASGGAGSNGYVSPVGTLGLLSNGAIGAGGVSANNAVTVIYTATANYPTAASSTFIATTSINSATTTQIGFTASGFSVGDPCEVEYNGSTSTLITTANVTAVSGNAVTSTVTFLNISGSQVQLLQTSTITGVSSTVKTTCFHTGV